MEKKSVTEMRAELKLLREGHPDYQPVSKMKKSDISQLLSRLQMNTETTPAIAMEKKMIKMPKDLQEEPDEKPMKEKGIKKHMRDKDGVKSYIKDEKHSKEESHAKVKSHVGKVKPEKVEKAEGKKETMTERMAKLRAMKKK
jgi:hypothetical protein